MFDLYVLLDLCIVVDFVSCTPFVIAEGWDVLDFGPPCGSPRYNFTCLLTIPPKLKAMLLQDIMAQSNALHCKEACAPD